MLVVDLDGKVVVMFYFVIMVDYLECNGVKVEIVEMYGLVEVVLCFNIVDVICDFVFFGVIFEVNGLVVFEIVLVSEVVLVWCKESCFGEVDVIVEILMWCV